MRAETCPTCGGAVKIVSGDEGTSCYEPVQAPSFTAELEAQRRRADRAEETRENANAATSRAEGETSLLAHRLRDEIAWLSAHGHHERAKVVAGWIGVDLEGGNRG